MLDGALRQVKEQLLQPLADGPFARVRPDVITFIGFGFGVLTALAAYYGPPAVALLCWAANRVLDGLDGTVARRQRLQSDWGSYNDTLIDHMVYASVVIALALRVNTVPVYVALAWMLGAYYVNAASWMALSALLEKRALGAKARAELTSITMPPGLIEGTETIVFYTLFIVAVGVYAPALTWLFALFALLVAVTVVQRYVWARTALAGG